MENQAEKKKSGRGGAREGAGRPKTTEKIMGFRAPADIVRILENVPNKTEFICEAIREKASREK